MAAGKPIEIRPKDGGALITVTSPDVPGPANYLIKRDFRRVDDCEERSEGHDCLRPNPGIPLGNQPLFLVDDITLIHEVKRPNQERCLIAGTKTTLYRYVSQSGGGYFTPETGADIYYRDVITDGMFKHPIVAGQVLTLSKQRIAADTVEIIRWTALGGEVATGVAGADYILDAENGTMTIPAGSQLITILGQYLTVGYTVESDYFAANPGEWIVIGSGFSPEGKRWQVEDLNGYVVLNNGVDLPMTYRVEDTQVQPMYELRELGIASVGVILVVDTYLLCMDLRLIRDEDFDELMGLVNSGDTVGTQVGGVTGAPAIVLGTMAAGSQVVTASANIFEAGMVGKTVRFRNGFSAVVAEFYDAKNVRLDTAAESNINGVGLIVTRPILTGYVGSVYGDGTLEAQWLPTAPLNNSGLFTADMAGEYYALFKNGWASGIDTVTDLKTLLLDKAPDAPLINEPFTLVPSEYLLELSGGTFTFTDSMAGCTLFYGSRQREIVAIVDATHALMSSDYPLAGQLFMSNPDAYAPYTGPTDGIGFRIWPSMPSQPRRYGAIGECSAKANDWAVRLKTPMQSLARGDEITITGAGEGGGNLTSTIRFISGTTIFLTDIARTTIKEILPLKVSTLTHAADVATLTTLDNHGAETGQTIQIAGAKPAGYNGLFTATVTGPKTLTYEMLADPAADATGDDIELSAAGAQLQRTDAANAPQYEDIQDDGSAIIQGSRLGKVGVLNRETSIWMAIPTGRTDAPFAYDLVYGGSQGDDRSGCLAFPNAVASVNDEFLVWLGANDVFRFDLVSRKPQVFGPLHVCRKLFFGSAATGVDVFAAENRLTREAWFCLPGAKTDRCVRYDSLMGTVSTSPMRVTAAATVSRPVTDDVPNGGAMFVMAADVGTQARALTAYGLVNAETVQSSDLDVTGAQAGTTVTASDDIFLPEHLGRTIVFDSGEACVITDYLSSETVTVQPKQAVASGSFQIVPRMWHRFGRDYGSELASGWADFGSASLEKTMNSYAVQLAERHARPAFAQAVETGLVIHVRSPLPFGPIRLGRVNVTVTAASLTYTRYEVTGFDPDDNEGSEATTALVAGVHYEVDTVNGFVQLLPVLPLAYPLARARLTLTFSCAAVACNFRVSFYGGFSPGKGVSLLGYRDLKNPDSGYAIKTGFRQYLLQDRILVSGAHNPARLALRIF
jgi:hypothetical protein